MNKYRVSKKSDRTYNGTVYMSKLEMLYRKHLDLKMKVNDERERVISYQEQVPFKIVVNGFKICVYKLDFEVKYADRVEYIDIKGVRTSVYIIKKKLVEALFGIKITEITKGDFRH